MRHDRTVPVAEATPIVPVPDRCSWPPRGG